MPEDDDEIIKGDKLELEDGTVLYVTSAAKWQCPQGEFLTLTVSRSA